jgi:vancomycin resistance protein YoaR
VRAPSGVDRHRAIDGVVVPAGGVFSFWAQVGRPVARRGFAPGRELREGCLVPSVGGGLCRLSNALYQAALETDD